MAKKDNLKYVEGGILAEGEATGHAHTVDVPVHELENGVRTFNGPTAVRHQEHKSFKVKPNEYASGRVLETDHLEKVVRAVSD